ncbi:hypothetical protein AB4Z17_08530 [Paenibacillus sp. TAF43_2]
MPLGKKTWTTLKTANCTVEVAGINVECENVLTEVTTCEDWQWVDYNTYAPKVTKFEVVTLTLARFTAKDITELLKDSGLFFEMSVPNGQTSGSFYLGNSVGNTVTVIKR